LRNVVLVTTAALLAVALLASSSIVLASKLITGEVNKRVQSTAAVSSVVVSQQFTDLEALVHSYASRPSLVAALTASPRPTATIESRLTGLATAAPGISDAFLASDAGVSQATYPLDPSVIGRSFAYREWYQGLHASGRPYVGEAIMTAEASNPLAVTVAAYVRGFDNTPIAILGIQYSLSAIQAFGLQIAKAQAITLTVTDQAGTSLGAGGQQGLVSLARDPAVLAAQAGRSGLLNYAPILPGHRSGAKEFAAYTPVAGIGWTVTASIPDRTALAGAVRIRNTVLAITALLVLILLIGAWVMARSDRGRRQSERDIRDRDRQLARVLESTDQGFVSVDATGAITAWNAQAEALFGWAGPEVLGRSLDDVVLPAAHRGVPGDPGLPAAGTVAAAVGKRADLITVHRDGHQIPVEMGAWAHDDGGGFSVFVHDITERVNTQADLREARDQAMQASRLKSEFLANMSHEIRTPLNGVLGMTSLLLETELGSEQRDFAETVRGSGESLLGLLNDILDFSKIEAGHLDLESIDFDPQSLVEDVANLLSLPAHEKGVELVCNLPVEGPTTVRGDPGRFRQILTNLVGNAVKFTSSGEVVVQLTVDGRDETTTLVHCEVIDTGIGIAPADQADLFNSFSQVDASTTRLYGGTGLGLAISRQLVELMGGHIGVRSEIGQGSTFWFTLPLVASPAAPPAPKASLGGLRILVVDDNATNRIILTRFLQSWGIRSEQADGAAEARLAIAASVAEGQPFDAALLDLQMPGMDGIDLAGSIAADPSIPSLKMVLLSSAGLGGETEKARDAGITGYLTKPVRQSQLYDCLAIIMGAAELTRPTAAVASCAAANARSVGGGARGTILIAEDNAVNQRVAAAMVKSLGYQVEVVADGAQAVNAVKTTTYQAILMDCQMPVLDGYQATASIRGFEVASQRVPIIAVTASAMRSDHQYCLAAGMDDYVAKPLSLEALAEVLARWLPDALRPGGTLESELQRVATALDPRLAMS
jgi:PAS domain S-box-containing protein